MMPRDSSQQQPAYVVDRIDDVFGPVTFGQTPDRYKRVYFHTPNAGASYEDVAFAPGWVEKVHDAIMRHVAELQAAKALAGPVG